MLQFFYKMKKNKKGFTLIELVVVIAILGILALIAIPRLAGAQVNAQRRAVETNLRTIDSAIMMRTATGAVGDPTYTTGTDPEDLAPAFIAALPNEPAGVDYGIETVDGESRAVVTVAEDTFGANTAQATCTIEELAAVHAADPTDW